MVLRKWPYLVVNELPYVLALLLEGSSPGGKGKKDVFSFRRPFFNFVSGQIGRFSLSLWGERRYSSYFPPSEADLKRRQLPDVTNQVA